MTLQRDLFQLIRSQQAESGQLQAEQLHRLPSSVLKLCGPLHWRLLGRHEVLADGSRPLRMDLALNCEIELECVRCLQPTILSLSAQREYLVVADEHTADSMDVDTEDYDVIAGSKTFDLLELIEDEALLALPSFAAHERCELPAKAQAGITIDKPNPFAVLSKLKDGKGGG
jgi:uncharacterized protein